MTSSVFNSKNIKINSLNRRFDQFHQFMTDIDNEDDLSIKSGVSIASDDEDADNVSEAYQEIKDVLMTNQPPIKVTLKPKDVNFYDWGSPEPKDWNNNFGQASTTFLKKKKKIFPELKHTYFKPPPVSVSQTEKQQPTPKYEHFNNWKMHLLKYKQTKGYGKNDEENGGETKVIGKKNETPTTMTATTTRCSNMGVANNVKIIEVNKENSFIDSFESMSGFNMISVSSLNNNYIEHKPFGTKPNLHQDMKKIQSKT
jgi:hypothetical protein